MLKPIAVALCCAFIVIGCGDNNKGNPVENCDTAGDEDGNGTADCADPTCATAIACAVRCGNGRKEAQEACDDGNVADGDGCDSNCTTTGCGNGVKTMNEGCDDGNATSGDGCDANCMTTGCGNGVKTGTEACDDGNTVSGDGCDNNCTVTACGNNVMTGTETCDDGNTVSGDGCDSNCTITACGNNVMTGTEACDDGNLISGDGCDANCTITGCGNNIMTGAETCDDGNLISGDGCDSNCTITACGNGVMTGTEACDDGNAVNGDGCDNNCTASACGNSIVAGTEVCDDGNLISGDGCDANCTITSCGNGIRTGTEVCDDGNAVNGDGCDVNCTISACGNSVVGGTEVCDDGNLISGDGCDANCTFTGCGNGIPTAGETCDDGNTNNNDLCSNTCALNCGNGVVNALEACDDGNTVNGDGCDVNCTVSACGNGITAGAEQCDDGNSTNLDGCNATCAIEPLEVEPNEDGTPQTGGSGILGNDFAIANPDLRTIFSGNVTIRAAMTPVGDEDIFVFTNTTATKQAVRFDVWNPTLGIGVACATTFDTGLQIKNAAGTSLASNDDRNGAADRCSGIVFVMAPAQRIYVQLMEFGDNATIAAYALQATYTPVVCGDSVIGPSETCDDGNIADGDGCDSNCTITACGNGVTTTGETCDDGNTVQGDGCDNNCTITACGNGVITTGETCDDGNTTPGDGCNAVCQLEVTCGDLVIAGTEQCDDGNTAPGDGCSATCQVEITAEVEPNGTIAEAMVNPVQITGRTMIQGAITPLADKDVFQLTVTTPTVIHLETFTSIFNCAATGTIDLRLFDGAGAPIIADTAGAGIGSCGALTFFLAAGTFFVQVEERGNNALLASYFLEVGYQTDRLIEGEAANTSGVNETTATASLNLTPGNNVYVFGDHTLNGDVDVYAITVPGQGRIRAEIIEGDRAIETCESNSVDSRLTLFDPAGVQLVDDDDDGRGFCSQIDGTGTTPLDAAARNTAAVPRTFFVMVRQSSFATGTAAQFIYRLQVTTR